MGRFDNKNKLKLLKAKEHVSRVEYIYHTAVTTVHLKTPHPYKVRLVTARESKVSKIERINKHIYRSITLNTSEAIKGSIRAYTDVRLTLNSGICFYLFRMS